MAGSAGFCRRSRSSRRAGIFDIYSGLWYQIVIALATFVIGILFVKDTRKSNVYHED